MVTDSSSARNEDHPGWGNAGHEQRVMVGAAHHLFEWQIVHTARLSGDIDDLRIALSRSIGIYQFNPGFHSSARCQVSRCIFDRGTDSLAAISITVAYVDLQLDPARNAIYRRREHVAYSCRGDGIVSRGRFRGSLDRKNDFGGGAQRIPTVNHQHPAGMTTLAGDPDPQAGRSGDGGYNSNRQLVPLQQWALLNMQF